MLHHSGVFNEYQEKKMAIDVYMQIEGIKGESQDAKHKDWIECLSWNAGLNQPRSTSASTAGGHTAERVEFEMVTIRKLADLSSPILMQHCAMGKTIPKITFQFMRADGNGAPINYFEIVLTNAIIGTFHPGIEVGTFLQEQVGFHFAKMNMKYTQQKIGGGVGGSTIGGWDLASNKPA
jgi:type VI secretion system secreted protein Hcp